MDTRLGLVSLCTTTHTPCRSLGGGGFCARAAARRELAAVARVVRSSAPHRSEPASPLTVAAGTIHWEYLGISGRRHRVARSAQARKTLGHARRRPSVCLFFFFESAEKVRKRLSLTLASSLFDARTTHDTSHELGGKKQAGDRQAAGRARRGGPRRRPRRTFHLRRLRAQDLGRHAPGRGRRAPPRHRLLTRHHHTTARALARRERRQRRRHSAALDQQAQANQAPTSRLTYSFFSSFSSTALRRRARAHTRAHTHTHTHTSTPRAPTAPLLAKARAAKAATLLRDTSPLDVQTRFETRIFWLPRWPLSVEKAHWLTPRARSRRLSRKRASIIKARAQSHSQNGVLLCQAAPDRA